MDNSSGVIASDKDSNNDFKNSRQKCGYCSSTFDSQQQLVFHLKMHSFICIKCHQTFYNEKALESHMSSQHPKKKWLCKFCDKQFLIRSRLEEHLQSHLSLKPFKCDRCGKNYSRLSYLKIHKCQHLANDTFDCSQCPQKFSNRSKLSKHLQHVHETLKTHKCMLCPMEFLDLQSLELHVDSHASNETDSPLKSFLCQFCQEEFTTEDKLSQHLGTHAVRNSGLDKKKLRVNSKKDQFQCKICSKTFLKLTNLNNHLKCHSENVQWDFFCSLCPNEKFICEELLLKHRKFVHKEKTPFVCKYCQKKFLFHSVLTLHLRTHTGEKPFCCSHCNKSFSQLSSLKVHIKRHKKQALLSSEKIVQQMNPGPQNGAKCDNMNQNKAYKKRRNKNNCEETDHLHNEANAPNVYKDSNGKEMNETDRVRIRKRGPQNKSEVNNKTNVSLSENVSLNPENIPPFIHYPEDLVNQYEENLPAISELSSSQGIDPNTGVKEKENKVTILKNVHPPYDSSFYRDENGCKVLNHQCRVSLTHLNGVNRTPLVVTENKTKKHYEGPDLAVESLLDFPSNSLNALTHSNNQCGPNKQSENVMTPFEEVIIIPVTDSFNDDNIRKNSYVINFETDLQNRIVGSEEEPCRPYLGESHMTPEQIPTDAVAVNHSRVLQYLNSQNREFTPIKEANRKNLPPETTATVRLESAESPDLIDLTDEINDTETNLFFPCSICKNVLLHANELNDHMKSHTVVKPFVCGYCQKSFQYSCDLKRHVNQHKKQIAAPFSCTHCSKRFPSLNSFVLHQQMHKKECRESNETQLKHIDSSAPDLNTPDNVSHLRSTTLENAENKSGDASKTELWRHSTQTENIIEQKSSRLLTCEYCGKVFRYRSLLNQHLDQHTGKKPFNCPTCKKSFTRISFLKVHQKRHQSRTSASSLSSGCVVPFSCVKQSSIKVSSPSSSSVVSLPLSKEPRTKVSSPSSASVTQKLLLLTKKQNTIKNEKSFDSNSANQSFAKSCNLRNTRQRQRRFICDFCKKEFPYRSQLAEHLPKHTGEKAFTCRICKKSYRNFSYLRIHLNKCAKKCA